MDGALHVETVGRDQVHVDLVLEGLAVELHHRDDRAHPLRVDLSPERVYTLSPHARRILEGLDRDVHVTVFVRSEDARTPVLKDLLWRVGSASRRVRYNFVDLNRSPALARSVHASMARRSSAWIN